MHNPTYTVPSGLQFTEHFINDVTEELIKEKSYKHLLFIALNYLLFMFQLLFLSLHCPDHVYILNTKSAGASFRLHPWNIR